MPEDHNGTPPPEVAPEAPPNPWQAYEQAGFAPDQNPYELRQAVDWVQAITDESRHEQELERSLREWNHLPQGVTFQEMKAAAQQIAASRQDPFAQQPAPQPNGYPEQQPYQPQPDYGDPYAQPQQQPVDPNLLRQTWQSDFQQAMQAERQQFEQQLQAQRLQDDLTRQVERVTREHNLDERAQTWVGREIDRRLRAGEIQNQQQLATLAADAWRDLNEFRQQAVAGAIQAQQGAPRTMTPTGATPGSLPPPVGLEGAFARARNSVGMGPDQ